MYQIGFPAAYAAYAAGRGYSGYPSFGLPYPTGKNNLIWYRLFFSITCIRLSGVHAIYHLTCFPYERINTDKQLKGLWIFRPFRMFQLFVLSTVFSAFTKSTVLNITKLIIQNGNEKSLKLKNITSISFQPKERLVYSIEWH